MEGIIDFLSYRALIRWFTYLKKKKKKIWVDVEHYVL